MIPTDLATGIALRDAGMARAGSAVPAAIANDWRSKAKVALTALANTGTVFSADDLVKRVGEPPVPNMLGPLFAHHARLDIISAVGFRQAQRPSAHARIQRTWEGK